MKIVIYTSAINGSGDFHAALKALPLLLRADQTLDITWIVRTQQALKNKIDEARNKFPTVNITHIDPKYPTGLSSYSSEDIIEESAQEIISKIPPDTEKIIVLPDVSDMDHLQAYFSKHCPQAGILNISEYDFKPTTQFGYAMGLGKGSFGVLIPETVSGLTNQTELQDNPGLSGLDLNAPFFFGYANVQGSDLSDPKEFIRSVLAIAKREHHQKYQLVMNIPWNEIPDDLGQWVDTIEYHSNDGSIIKSTVNHEPKTPKTLKIFNPFPVSSDKFRFLLDRSQTFTLCTGDQSLIESIFASKCVFYQVMSWKTELKHALVELVEEICGKDSMYYKIVACEDDLSEFLEETRSR